MNAGKDTADLILAARQLSGNPMRRSRSWKRGSGSGGRLRTTNALENLNREFRWRTKTQASFSSEESAVTLLFHL